MLPLAAVTATRPAANPWFASIYAGVATAIGAFAVVLLMQAENAVLAAVAFLLIGVGPVIGYQLATGQLGADWKPIVAGLVSFVVLILGFILWPILVGAVSRNQSIGKLFVGSLIGFILGVIVFLVLASAMGQNPSWLGPGFTLAWAVWGGACAAFMTAWAK
jgi:hypothetical protein